MDNFSFTFRSPNKYRLRIQNGLILCEYDEEKGMPNLFRRFFYWLLLGWTFEKIEK